MQKSLPRSRDYSTKRLNHLKALFLCLSLWIKNRLKCLACALLKPLTNYESFILGYSMNIETKAILLLEIPIFGRDMILNFLCSIEKTVPCTIFEQNSFSPRIQPK